jgi:hypothetical protein
VASDGFRIDNNKEATANEPVKDQRLTGTKGAEILIDCGTRLLLYVCKVENCTAIACTFPDGKNVRDPEVKEWSFKPTRSRRFESWLDTFLRREPTSAPVAAARTLGGPADAVVLQDAKGIHWAPALAGVLEGNYCLVLRALPSSGQTWTTNLQWDRRREPDGLAPIPGLRPGLYELRKGPAAGGTCQPDPNEDAGWVLVAGSADFPQLEAEWRSHAASIETLEQSGTSPHLISTLRRVVLAGLAEP